MPEHFLHLRVKHKVYSWYFSCNIAVLNRYTMDSIFPSLSDQELRIWCAEQCHDANGELNLEKMEQLYQFVSSAKKA